MLRRALLPVLLLVAALFPAPPAHAQKSLDGVALVIGQSDYAEIPALANPANDARAMVKLLTDLGFDARAVTDRDGPRLRRDLERFAEDAEGADVALVYYSGHGIEAAGENWLIPVDAGVASLDDAEEQLVPLSSVIERLRETVAVTIVLLDACRTSPFPPGATLKRTPTGSAEPVSPSGLTPVRGVKAMAQAKPAANENLGMVVGFAAEPGQPALDGDEGGNSPYAAALLRHLTAMQGVEFGQVMRMVTEEVYLATGTKQRPWMNESLRRLLYFGLAPDEPQGVDGAITRERRQLLLTMADLPTAERVSVERAATREGVRLDALYGVLRAMGQDVVPDNPEQLERLLGDQAGRLKQMEAQRAALRSDDPQIAMLSTAAGRAIEEGAIATARDLLDQAVARVEQTEPTVDALEEQLKAKRIADAAVYAQRASAGALAFAFRDAAADYGRAFELVERWDDKLAWNYRNEQAEALRDHGEAHGDRSALEESLAAYQTVLNMVPNGERNRDWAITRNNMAVVLNTIGEMEESTENLERAMAMFEDSMTVLAGLGDDIGWASSQNNVGNILLVIAEREGNLARFEQARQAYLAALARRDRGTVPVEWANTQNNIAIVEYKIASVNGDVHGFERAEAAYRSALEVLTPATARADWGSTQNNLGNTLVALGRARNDTAALRKAIEAFEAALTVRDRQSWPQLWASTQVNIGYALVELSNHEMGSASIEQAAARFEAALEIFDRHRQPLDWAAATNNLASALRVLGQVKEDLPTLERSIAIMRTVLDVYTRERFPMDWAGTHYNLGNAYHLMANLAGDPGRYEQAAEVYRESLKEYRRDRSPMLWAVATGRLAATMEAISRSQDHPRSLRESVELRRAALEVLTAENNPIDWGNAQSGLGSGLYALSLREQRADVLPEALAAFEASMRVFTRETQPLQWAFAQNNIGDVHWSLATEAGGGEAALDKALASYDAAKQAFAELGFTPAIELIDRKVALIRDMTGKQ